MCIRDRYYYLDGQNKCKINAYKVAALNVTSDAEQAVMISLVLVRNSAPAQTRCLLKNDCNVIKFAQTRVTSKTSS